MNEFISVKSIPLTQEEIDYIVNKVKDSLERLNLPCTDCKLVANNETFTEIVLKIDGLSYTNRDNQKNAISGVNKIKIISYKYEGYSNSERLEIAKKNKTISKDIDSAHFRINFYMDLNIRKYRHRFFNPHNDNRLTIWIASIDNKELWEKFYSYMVNIKAIKGL